jgi:hypothetical protein
MGAVRSLKKAVVFKHGPSSWHAKYRTMDDLCLLIRSFRKYYKQSPPRDKELEEWDEDFSDVLDDVELNVVKELLDILENELKEAEDSDRGRNMIRAGGDVLSTNAISRGNHFVYGILDLIQQHMQTCNNGKINENVRRITLHLVRNSQYSNVRCKALEALASLRTKIGLDIIEHNITEAIECLPVARQKQAEDQWKTIYRRFEDMQRDLARYRKVALPPPALNLPVLILSQLLLTVDLAHSTTSHPAFGRD